MMVVTSRSVEWDESCNSREKRLEKQIAERSMEKVSFFTGLGEFLDLKKAAFSIDCLL